MMMYCVVFLFCAVRSLLLSVGITSLLVLVLLLLVACLFLSYFSFFVCLSICLFVCFLFVC